MELSEKMSRKENWFCQLISERYKDKRKVEVIYHGAVSTPPKDEKRRDRAKLSCPLINCEGEKMSFMHNLLCKLGIHKWRLVFHPDWKTIRVCRICGKTQVEEKDGRWKSKK